MSTFFPGLLLLFLGFASRPASDIAKELQSFDFCHVESALAYFDTADEQQLLRMAECRATEHLLTHSGRTGYYPVGTTAPELTRELLEAPELEQPRVAEVKRLISYVKANAERQAECLREAERYLPDQVRLMTPLYLTWGYDIGVAMDGSASLNLAHDHFLEDSEEIWFFCIHEMHHAGVTSLHPMVAIREITTTRQVFDFLRYATFLEGTATYAAYETRARASALEGDRDYVALADRDRMDRYRVEYFETYEQMASASERELSESDWNALENFSDGDRLWYRVGAEMAAAIDEEFGRARFREILADGPDAFFSAYFASQQQD